MPTLRETLEEVAGLGQGYLICDRGSYWLARDLLERLNSNAPERLAYSTSLVMPDADGDGAIYAAEDAYGGASALPLYSVHWLSSALLSPDALEAQEHHP